MDTAAHERIAVLERDLRDLAKAIEEYVACSPAPVNFMQMDARALLGEVAARIRAERS